MAHKKGAGSTKNGRDSNSKRLGIKAYGKQFVKAGSIVVRQRGLTFKPGNGVKVGKDYKIGITSNISNRFKQYRSHSGYNANIIYLTKIKNPNELEKLLVNRYSHLCTKGDWFNFKQEDVLDLITYSSNFIYNERR